jgi:hypothetical protein
MTPHCGNASCWTISKHLPFSHIWHTCPQGYSPQRHQIHNEFVWSTHEQVFPLQVLLLDSHMHLVPQQIWYGLAAHLSVAFIGLAYQGNDIVFRFIIEYGSLRDRPITLSFWKMIFWLVLKVEISYRVTIPWRILVSFRWCFEDYIFAWWNIWVSIILLLP